MIVKKTKEQMFEVIEKSENMSDVINGLHRAVISDYDQREALNGFVYCNRETALEISTKIVEKFKSDGAFLWMNYGFSVLGDIPLLDWEFDISKV